jgi:manganese/zinc/iron transport system substrate-binding protein
MLKYIFIGLFTFVLLQCTSQESQQDMRRSDLSKRNIKIVTTTGMVADAVRNVGGDRVDVIALMGPGVDPHLYKASEGDVTRMQNADIIFYNGLHLEGKMTEIFERMTARKPTVAIAEKIEEESLLAPPEFAGNYDPHIWFDVNLWMKAMPLITQTLIQLDTLHQQKYLDNLEIYLAELRKLQEYVLLRASEVPDGKKVLITAHDAFNYFGQAYGFEVRGLQGISTASEAGTADVQNLAEFIVAKKIPAIFVESSVPPRSIEALQAAVRSRNFEVKIGGYLYSDAMGDEGTAQDNYLGMVRHNIDTIVDALAGIGD